MKILMMCSVSPWDNVVGGAERYIKEVSEHLAKKHELHVIVNKIGDLDDIEIIDGVIVHRLDYKDIRKLRTITYPLSYYRKTKAIINKYDIDIINALAPHPVGYIACRLGKKFNIPVLITFQNIIQSTLNNWIMKYSMNYVLKNATKIHAVSNYVKENIKHFNGNNISNISVIYNAVDVKTFNPQVISGIKIKKKYGLKFPTIICVAHFKKEQKRQDILIRAANKIIQHYPDAKFIFIGRNLFRGKGDQQYIQKLARKLGIKNNVLILGPKPYSEIPAFFAASDVFAFPTAFEGNSVSLLESLAMGVPVVATNVGPISEIIRDGIDGRLVPLTSDGFAQGILELLSDRKKLILYGKNGIMRVRKQFTWKKTSERIEKELLLLLDN